MEPEPTEDEDGQRTRDTPEERAHWIAQLRKAIDASGLSDRQFARQVLVRDDRNIRRWLAGDRAIPQMVREKIAQLLDEAERRAKRKRKRASGENDRRQTGYPELMGVRLVGGPFDGEARNHITEQEGVRVLVSAHAGVLLTDTRDHWYRLVKESEGDWVLVHEHAAEAGD